MQQFFAAGLSTSGKDAEAYVFLDRGTLAETNHNGRAHCLRIGARYSREGGIRQALESWASTEVLTVADQTFAEFTNSGSGGERLVSETFAQRRPSPARGGDG